MKTTDYDTLWKIEATDLYDSLIFVFICKWDEYAENNNLYNESNTPDMHKECNKSFALYQLNLGASDRILDMDQGFLGYWNDFVGHAILDFINKTLTPKNYLLDSGTEENNENFWQNFLDAQYDIPDEYWNIAKKEIKLNDSISVALGDFKEHIKDKYQYILSFGEEDKGELEFCHFPVSVEFGELEYLRSLETDGQELAGDADPMEY